MTRCCVRACPYFKKRPGVENTGLRCHRFPEDPKLRQKWIDWVNSANIAGVFKVSKQAGVCSAHFTSEDFNPMNKKLESDAVPSIAPEMTPEMAFKLGVARSAEDFIRSKQIKEENATNGSQEEMSPSTIIPDTDTVDWVQAQSLEREKVPAFVDTSSILVQSFSQYSSEPDLNLPAVDPLSVPAPVQRVFVVPVPVVKIKEDTEMTKHDLYTDSCFSDAGDNDSINLKGPPRLIFCKTAPSIISDTKTSSTSLPIFSSITAANTSGPCNIYPIGTGTDTIPTKINVDRSPVTFSFSANNAPAPSENTAEQGEESLPRQYKRRSYIRDLSPSDFSTPEKCKRSLGLVHSKLSKYQSKIKAVSQKLRRAQKTIQDLKALVKDNQKT